MNARILVCFFRRRYFFRSYCKTMSNSLVVFGLIVALILACVVYDANTGYHMRKYITNLVSADTVYVVDRVGNVAKYVNGKLQEVGHSAKDMANKTYVKLQDATGAVYNAAGGATRYVANAVHLDDGFGNSLAVQDGLIVSADIGKTTTKPAAGFESFAEGKEVMKKAEDASVPQPNSSKGMNPAAGFEGFAEEEGLSMDCKQYAAANITAQDLLPGSDDAMAWASGVAITSDSVATAFGTDLFTGSLGRDGSMKNPNLSLLPDPVIERVEVGPWLNSSYTRDTSRDYQSFFVIG